MTGVKNIKRKGPVSIEQFMFENACEKVTLRTSGGDKSVTVARDILLPLSPFLQSLLKSVSPCLPVTIILSEVPQETLDMFVAVIRNPGSHLNILNFQQLKQCDDLFGMLKINTNFFKISPKEKEDSYTETLGDIQFGEIDESFTRNVGDMDEATDGSLENIGDDGVIIESEMLKLSCQFCENEGFQQNELLAHLKTHIKELSSEDMVLKCPSSGCQKTFEYFNSYGRKLEKRRQLMVMEDHLRSKHTKISVLMCDQCGKGFYSKMSQKYHIKQHTDQSKFYCNICDHFIMKDLQAKHLTSCQENKNVTQCSVCGKCFNSEGNLQMHKLIHSSKKPFNCDQCNKGFSQKGNLKTHKIRKHY